MRKLGTMTKEELRNLYNNNNDFQVQINEWIYERMMDLQREEGELLHADVFRYEDYYSSFVLMTPIRYGLRDGWSVAHKLDSDYLNEDASKLYDELNKLADELENMEADELDEKQDDYEDKMNDVCDKLAEAITDQLRAYENWGEDELDYELELIADGEHYASNWETDGTTIYEHITKEYK